LLRITGYSVGKRCGGVLADMHNQPDAELMKLVLDKNRKALEELYDRYVRLIYSFAMKSTKDEERARTIVQLVFTRLWTTEKGYDASKGAFVNWLLTITRNCMIDETRKDKKHKYDLYLEINTWHQMSDQADENHPEKAAMHRLKKEQIQQAFKWLSEHQIKLIQLLYWEGYSLREIAELNKEPLGTIKSRLHQALKVLRHHMMPERESEV
jgi:RNA polymerase sigma factor (sigma-70 family)